MYDIYIILQGLMALEKLRDIKEYTEEFGKMINACKGSSK